MTVLYLSQLNQSLYLVFPLNHKAILALWPSTVSSFLFTPALSLQQQPKKNFALIFSSNMSSRSALTQRHHTIADIPPTEPPSQRDLVQEVDRRTRSQLKTNGSIFGHATIAEIPMATISLLE